jgi:hypothetical protein
MTLASRVTITQTLRHSTTTNMGKTFKIRAEDIVPLVTTAGGCLATDRITVDGNDVCYMYREESERPLDTGWRFFSGDESSEYLKVSSHTDVYDINTIANYEPAILSYIDTPAPCAFERIPGSRKFRRVET